MSTYKSQYSLSFIINRLFSTNSPEKGGCYTNLVLTDPIRGMYYIRKRIYSNRFVRITLRKKFVDENINLRKDFYPVD